MAIKPVHPVPDKIPSGGLICHCPYCKKDLLVTEWSDLTHGLQYLGSEPKKQDAVYILCPLCKTHAAYPQSNMATHIADYELWVLSNEPAPTWEQFMKCPECRNSHYITVKNMTWINEPGDTSDTWKPKVHMHCPTCFTDTPTSDLLTRIPMGIKVYVLKKAEESRK